MKKKLCPRCKKRRMFNRNAARHDGLAAWCRICSYAYMRDYYKLNPNKRKEKDEKFDKKYPTYARDYGLRTKYGLTEKLFQKILKFQKGQCAICKTDKPGGRYKVLQIDHDHIKNLVRGLLCFNCNKHLGFYERISEGILNYLKMPPAVSALGGKYGVSLYQS